MDSKNFINWIKKHQKKLLVSIVLYAGILGVLVTQVKFLNLTSESIQYRFCLQFYNIPPQKGYLCVFKLKEFTFVKYLAGTPGDIVKRIKNRVYVNSEFIGKVSKCDGLTPIGSFVIPKGYVFVAGTHKDSLDSRYKEFGLIKEKDLMGLAVGCLKR